MGPGRAAFGAMCLAIALLAPGLPGPGAGPGLAEAADGWERGRHDDFTPPATKRPEPEVGRRSLPRTLELSETAVQRSRVGPGDVALLRAQYAVEAPSGTLEVLETRIIAFEGQRLATLKRVVARPTGAVGSQFELTVPPDAVPGMYTVTTIIESVSEPSQTKARAVESDQQRAITMFVVESPSGPAPGPPRPDEDQVRIRLWSSKKSYRIGEAVQVFFETNNDGYVTLVNVGTTGQITVLYPNAHAPQEAVKRGQTYSVPSASDPYEITSSGPPGVELVYAIFTTTFTRFVGGSFTHGSFRVVNDRADALARDMTLALKKIPLKEQSKAALEIDITP